MTQKYHQSSSLEGPTKIRPKKQQQKKPKAELTEEHQMLVAESKMTIQQRFKIYIEIMRYNYDTALRLY